MTAAQSAKSPPTTPQPSNYETALRDAKHALKNAPWYPPRGGEHLTVHHKAGRGTPAFTETYIVTQIPDDDGRHLKLFFAGCAPEGHKNHRYCGFYAMGDPDSSLAQHEIADPLWGLWLEVWLTGGTATLTVTRFGEVLQAGSNR